MCQTESHIAIRRERPLQKEVAWQLVWWDSGLFDDPTVNVTPRNVMSAEA